MSIDQKVELYTQDYVENCFWHWYSIGRPTIAVLARTVRPDNTGKAPTSVTLNKWKREGKWDERVAELDLKVRDVVERQYVSAKTEMLSRHAQIGRDLIEKAVNALRDMDLKSAHAALRAIELGIEIEKDSSNLEKLLSTVALLEDSKLVGRMEYLLGKTVAVVDGESRDLVDELEE